MFVSPEPSPAFVWAYRLDDDSGFILRVSRGTDPDTAAWLGEPAGGDAVFRPLWPCGVAKTSIIDRDGSTLFAITDLDAPRSRIVAIDLADCSPAAWRTVVPESEANLAGGDVFGGRWLTWRSEHGWYRLENRARGGGGMHPVTLRVEASAGHAMGASTQQVINRVVDHHAFLWTALTGGFSPVS